MQECRNAQKRAQSSPAWDGTPHSCIRAFVHSCIEVASERVPDAEFERVRLLILVARENPGEPIAFFVFEQDDLIVDRSCPRLRENVRKTRSDTRLPIVSRAVGLRPDVCCPDGSTNDGVS